MNDLSLVESMFITALAKPSPEARAAYLDAACADPELRRHVEQLIAVHPRVGNFLDGAAPNGGAPMPTEDREPVSERPGTVVGAYKLMEQIGEGGMGLVFVAEQQQPVRRKVAFKVIKPGMDTRQVEARFEAERQALALMDHPHIAKVLDAGSTDSGRPYFVMELVRGVLITEYCDTNNLVPKDRLGLFIQVCQAVQHAHQKGVIHRDLKPSNILVAPHDGVPVVKVIDFGVAKALGQQLTDKTIYTRFAQMIGTPLYMSPEQAEVNQLDVDTRSDVYSLGVLLYELLTGTTPFDRQRFQQAAFDEIRRIIKEEEPPKPSTRLTSLGATLSTVSARRGTEPGRLSKLVRGELDWIVMRCLEKDRTRRYDSAAGLAKDVQRYLADETVEARPASTWYRLRKAYRRNRAALTIAAGFAALLVAGLGLVTWKWQDERSARADADEARRDAESKAVEIQQTAERMNEANAAIDLAGERAMLSQWAAAEAAHNRAIGLRPDHSRVWLQRGELYAEMGLWDLALEDYTRSFELRAPDNLPPWLGHALLRRLQGDEAGYLRIRQRMVERFGESDEPYTRGTLIRAYFLPDVLSEKDQRLSHVEITRFPANVFWVGLYSRGLGHYGAGRYNEAVRDLRASLTKTTYRARLLNYPVLAMALYRSGQTGAARDELENCRKEYKHCVQLVFNSRDDLVPLQQWYDWAEFLVHRNAAHRLIEQAQPPDDPHLSSLRGRAFARLGRLDRAGVEYARSVELAPNDYSIRLEAFRFHAGAKRWNEMEAELSALKNLSGADPKINLEAFRTFAANGRWDRAVTEHAAAVRMKPDDIPILLERFRFHAARGEIGEADRAYAEATKDRDGDVPFRIKCADACARFRQWRRACDECARILDVDILGDGELNRSAWLKLAVLQLYLGDVEAYRRTCIRLVERHGEDPDQATSEILVRLCLLQGDPGVPPAKVFALAKRSSKKGTYPTPWVHNLAVAAERAGNRDMDLHVLQDALDRFDWTSQRLAIARLHQQRGESKKARSAMSRIRTNDRAFVLVEGSTGRWDLNGEVQLWYQQAEAIIQAERWSTANWLVEKQQWAQAVRVLGQLLTPEDKDASDWATRGNCLAELGRWKEAAADFAKADALDPDSPLAALKYGSVCLQLGDRDAYREHCQRVVARLAKSNNGLFLNNVAWLCVQDSAAESAAAQALPLVERAFAEKALSSNFVHTYACVLYRVGRYEDALKHLNDLSGRPGYSVNAFDWLFLAMTHARLGHQEEARSYLDRSSGWIAANKQQDWHHRAQLERFRAEAEALIRAGK